MADIAVDFGAATGFGTIDDFSLQSANNDVIEERAFVLDESGNEENSKLYGTRTDTSATYKADIDGSVPAVPAVIGALLDTKILTGISVSTVNNDYATMTLTGHQHAENAHAADPALATATHTMALADGFGGTDFLGATAGLVAAVMSSSCNITIQHADENDEVGDHLVGENYNCKIVATTTWVGVPTTTAAAAWDVTNVDTQRNNQGFLITVVTGEQSIDVA